MSDEIEACPTPEYHETHRYCPSCPWREESLSYTGDDCRCERPENTFQGVLRHGVEGTGLSLYCPGCGGWIEDSWLFSDGIPVEVTVESAQDYSGEWLAAFTLNPGG